MRCLMCLYLVEGLRSYVGYFVGEMGAKLFWWVKRMQISVYACDGCGKKTDKWPEGQGWFVMNRRVDRQNTTWHICSEKCLVKVSCGVCEQTTDVDPFYKNLISDAGMFGDLLVPNDDKASGASE